MTFRWAVAVAVSVGQMASAQASAERADLVVRNAAIYTVDPRHPSARALAVRDGRIIFVGAEEDVARHIGASTRVIDARGRFIMPGFHDAHVHLSLAASKLRWCDLGYPSTADLTRTRISDCVKAAHDKTWVLARNANTSVFPAAGPELAFWDSLVRDKPLYVDAVHSGFANSAALAEAGIGSATKDPPGGFIVRDGRGRATGTLRETAKPLVEQQVPKPTESELTRDFEAIASRLPSYGIASVQELTSLRSPGFFAAVQRRGKLPVRVRFGHILDAQTALPTNDAIRILAAPQKEFRDRWLSAGVIKVFVDGDLGDQTAALLAPYVGTEASGAPLWQPQILNAWVAALDAAGLQLHFHAMGDRAVRMALDAVEHAQARNGRRDARHQITHLHLVSTADLPRFRQLGVIANIQPSFATDIPWNTERALELLGPQRHANMFRFRDLLSAGAELAASTDTPIVSPSALATVETAMTRREPGQPGKPFLPEQKLSMAEAIRIATMGGARANLLDAESGSITVGKWADFIMLENDLLQARPRDVHEVKILWTVIEGRDAYISAEMSEGAKRSTLTGFADWTIAADKVPVF
jgi:predicted amidohydrolase YtcJ